MNLKAGGGGALGGEPGALEVPKRGGSEMQDHYDSYGIRETEVAIEEFVNRLVELYPDLDPLRASELIYEQVQNIVTAVDRGGQC